MTTTTHDGFEEALHDNPREVSICIYGHAGLGKSNVGRQMHDAGLNVAVLNPEQAAGHLGRVKQVTTTKHVDDALPQLRRNANGYHACILDGLDRLMTIATEEAKAGNTLGGKYRAPSTRDPRLAYAAAGQWLDDVLQQLHALPMITYITGHPRAFELDFVYPKPQVRIATKIDISVDLTPAARLFVEEKFDILAYAAMPPRSERSAIVVRRAVATSTAGSLDANNQPIPITKTIVAKHRIGEWARTTPLSWETLAASIGLDPHTLDTVPAVAYQPAGAPA